MRPGPLEIGLIVAVILLILVIMRVVRVARHATEKGKKSSTEISKRQVEKGAAKVQRHLKLLGIVFVLAGILLLLAGVNLLKWFFWSYLWSAIIITIGLAILFMSRKK